MEDEDKGAEPTVPLPVDDKSPATTTTTTSTTATDTTIGTETTDNSTTDGNAKSESPALIFAPGDHVIRWEMLPIAWPIQIHGIVLSVTDATLVLVDFGLTAAPQDNTNGNTEPPSPTAAAAVSTTTSPLSSSNRLDETATAATTTTEEAALSSSSVEPASTESTTTSNLQKKKPSIFSSDPKEMEEARKEWMEKSAATSKKILHSFQKLHPQTNKKRLNVIVLEDPAEWKKWKKVNYESGFFGFGKTNNNNNNSTTVSDDGLDSMQDDTNSTNNNNNNNNWWKKMKFGRSKKVSSSSNLSQQGDDTATESSSGWFAKPVNSNTTGNLPHSESGGSLGDATKQWWNKITNAQNTTTTTTTTSDAMDPTSSSQPPVKPMSPTRNGTLNVGDRDQQEQESSNANTTTGTSEEINQAPPPQLEMEMEDEEETIGGSESENQKVPQLELELEDTANDSEQKQEQKSPTAFMNPAMARLMESKKDEQQTQGSSRKGGLFGRNTPFFGKSKTKDTTTTETPQDGKAKKKLDLPKADPPKLVLARTRWLLHYGEAVLPPYHAFHSNSECIAVFCKTGYWSNLQADVFLHSTAIGNAKTMGAATLGVAASAPFLAPVIAGLGIGMVAAPWLILHSSKQQADDITLRMTEQFWAQAEPEVFVECIEHWSKLEEYYKRLESQKQDAPRVVTL